MSTAVGVSWSSSKSLHLLEKLVEWKLSPIKRLHSLHLLEKLVEWKHETQDLELPAQA